RPVSIAFRRSPRSPHGRVACASITGPRLHCLSAFSAFTTQFGCRGAGGGDRLSPLPFGVLRVHHAPMHAPQPFPCFSSPLPFRVLLVPHTYCTVKTSSDTVLSPLPFGVLRVHHATKNSRKKDSSQSLHCLSAFSAFTTKNEPNSP